MQLRIVAIVLALMAIYPLWETVQMRMRTLRAEYLASSGARASGIVTGWSVLDKAGKPCASRGCCYYIDYEFAIGQQRYLRWARVTEAGFGEINRGDAIEVFYDPKVPTRMVTAPELAWMKAWPQRYTLLVMAAVMLVVAVGLWRWRDDDGEPD